MGCGSSPGVPRIGNDWGACDPKEPKNRRTRCSLLIERFESGEAPTTVLVDTGPDLRAQLLAADVRHIDGVIYTHAHADHLHGIDDLRAFWLSSKRLIDVYATAPTISRLEEGFGYCFHSPEGSFYPPILKHNAIAAGSRLTVVGAGGPVKILPFRQVHGDIETLGLRIGGLAYSCDVSDLPDDSVAKIDGLDVWIVDALRYRSHPSHFNVEQSLSWIDRVRPRRAILTHMHNDLDYQRLKDELPAHVEPAYDGMQIEFNDDAEERNDSRQGHST
jgi:phosphoribosyl 1,2-cyclic phosphate phosphodiesterase